MRQNSSAQSDKRLRFSIRKFKAGVASVAIAAFWMTGGTVAASENIAAPVPEISLEAGTEPGVVEPVAQPVTNVPNNNTGVFLGIAPVKYDVTYTDVETTQVVHREQREQRVEAKDGETVDNVQATVIADTNSIPGDQRYELAPGQDKSVTHTLSEVGYLVDFKVTKAKEAQPVVPTDSNATKGVTAEAKMPITEVDGVAMNNVPTAGYTTESPVVTNMNGTNKPVYHDSTKQTFAVLDVSSKGDYYYANIPGEIYFDSNGNYSKSAKRGFTQIHQIAFSTEKDGSGTVYAGFYDANGKLIKTDTFEANKPQSKTYGEYTINYNFSKDSKGNLNPILGVAGKDPQGFFNELYTNYETALSNITKNKYIGYGWFVPTLIKKETDYVVDGTKEVIATVTQTDLSGTKFKTEAPQKIVANGKTYELIPSKSENVTGTLNPFVNKGDELVVGTDLGYMIHYKMLDDNGTLQWTLLDPNGNQAPQAKREQKPTTGTITPGKVDTVPVNISRSTGTIETTDVTTFYISNPYFKGGKTTYYYKEVGPAEELPKTGDVNVHYHIVDKEGNILTPNAVPKETVVKDGKVDSAYDATPKKKTDITVDGKTYYLVTPETSKHPATDGAPETGQVEADKTKVVNYYYVEQPTTGNVEVNYFTLENGQSTPLSGNAEGLKDKPSVNAVEVDTKDGKEGDSYDTTDLRPSSITDANGVKWVLSPSDTSGDDEKGIVEAGKTKVVEYYYIKEPAKTGSVVVNYVDTEGNVLQQQYTDTKDAPVGKSYDATENNEKPSEIVKDGKTYVLAPAGNYPIGEVTEDNNLRSSNKEEYKLAIDAIKGEIIPGERAVTYVYKLKEDTPEAPKPTGNVTVEHITTTGAVLKPETPVKTNEPTGTPYETKPEDKIVTEDGRTFVYKEVKQDSAPPTGTVTETPQKVTYVYEEVKGDVKVHYVNEAGETIKTSVVDTPESPTGTSYNTADDNKPNRITTEDGKVYEYVRVQEGSAPEEGKVVEGTTNVTYVYREVPKTPETPTPEAPKPTGNVTVEHITTTGEVLKPETPVKTNEPTGTPYETKPEDKIVTEDGRTFVYKEVKQDSAPPTGTVTETPQKVTYVYEEVKGDVKVHYVNEAGETIKTSVFDTSESPTGTSYNTADDNKPSRITTEDGKVYEYVRIQEGAAPEEGKVVEGTTNVTYVYREVKQPIIPTLLTPNRLTQPTIENQPAKEVIKQASASNQVLPNTGEKASTAVVIGSIATVIGLIGLRRRKED
ncbi:MucBP domain-containing protein [Streptococcus sp. S784/96/1]|uniref:MucBP domain-containing protein n=1 Tax=Streptococcus sp. S784/96/1 TaxID=2653499 RepID=UPI001389647E|nr:MucBP domain-containing protein [Streptococcus sp. S784/96/1]